MMTAGSAVREGLRLVGRSRTGVWALFFANLILAALAAYPIYHGMMSFSGHSLMSRSLAGGFSVDWLTDLDFNGAGALGRYAKLIGITALFSILLDALLAGGILAPFRDQSARARRGDFFPDCARYAWRLVRLMIIGLICYWIVFRVVNQSLGGAVDRWTRGWLDDRSVFAAKLAVGVLVILCLIFVNLVMDYAQVRLVIEDGTSAIQAFLASLGFSLARLGRAFVVYAIPSLCGIGLLVLYRLVTPWSAINLRLGRSGGGWQETAVLLLLFVGQQVIMFGRTWFRVVTWASEWAYFEGWRRERRS